MPDPSVDARERMVERAAEALTTLPVGCPCRSREQRRRVADVVLDAADVVPREEHKRLRRALEQVLRFNANNDDDFIATHAAARAALAGTEATPDHERTSEGCEFCGESRGHGRCDNCGETSSRAAVRCPKCLQWKCEMRAFEGTSVVCACGAGCTDGECTRQELGEEPAPEDQHERGGGS